jgi:SAM-dependent methyltransferase
VDARKIIVARGYDRVAELYAAWEPEVDGTRRTHLEALHSMLPSRAAVLDLGCGTGVHATAELAANYQVVAVDLSEHSVRIAKRALPGVSFVRGDIGSVAFAPGSFDAVIAFYSLIHVPREEHADIVRSIRSWLRPGGWFVATMGAGDGAEGTGEFLGAEMFWSSWDAGTNVELIRNAGLDVVDARDETDDEDGQPITHRWITARRPT